MQYTSKTFEKENLKKSFTNSVTTMSQGKMKCCAIFLFFILRRYKFLNYKLNSTINLNSYTN